MEFVDDATLSSDGEVTESSSRGISRRSVMKAGAAAAWSVPLVQVVAAAPANAATSGAPVLSFTTCTANYGTSAGASAADPSHLFVTAVVKNTGGVTAGLTVTLTIPANLHDAAPTVSPSAGWSASPATGSLTAGWTIVLTVADQLGAGASSPTLSATLTFNDAASWRTFDGSAFDLTLAATATNPGAQSGTGVAHVDAAPTVTGALKINGFVAKYVKNKSNLVVGTQTGSPSSRTKVGASGATSSVGPINLTVTIPKSGPFNTATPPAAAGNTWWAYSTTSSAAANWVYVFTSLDKIAPDSSSADFEATFTLAANANLTSLTVTGDASGARATPAPQVSANAAAV